MITLYEICKNITNSVDKEEYDYWIARRAQYFEEGIEAVHNTIEDDIAEGFYYE